MDATKNRTPTLALKQPNLNTQWYKGRLCPIKKQNAWFINPMLELPHGYDKTKDVFMYPNYISKYVLPVVEGDTMEFILGDRDKTKPMAQKVRVSQYSPRTCKELNEYIRKLTKEIDCVNFQNVLVQVLPCTAMWKFLGSPKFKGVQGEEYPRMRYAELLLSLLKLILHHGKTYKTLCEEVIKTVTRGAIFQIANDQSLPKTIKSCNYGKNDKFYSEEEEVYLSAELVRSFCRDAVQLVPAVTRSLLPTVAAISDKISSPSTQRFLYALLSLNSAGENGFIANAGVWMELSLIPTNQELLGNLVEKDTHLSPVKTRFPYDDPDQYMDTYFRLIRAETFAAIQHGIKDLMASTLDLRDMNVYYDIHLAGFVLQNSRFSLAIHFTPTQEVTKWEASPQLMYGNLVCFSLNGKFDDVIWATVSNRDVDLLNKNRIIIVELLDDNVKGVSEIINSLQNQGGSAIMVESPTYYHSLSPILRRLQEFDMENFPLQREIVYVEPGRELPGYLKKATFDTSIVCSPRMTNGTEEVAEIRGDEEDARIGVHDHVARGYDVGKNRENLDDYDENDHEYEVVDNDYDYVEDKCREHEENKIEYEEYEREYDEDEGEYEEEEGEYEEDDSEYEEEKGEYEGDDLEYEEEEDEYEEDEGEYEEEEGEYEEDEGECEEDKGEYDEEEGEYDEDEGEYEEDEGEYDEDEGEYENEQNEGEYDDNQDDYDEKDEKVDEEDRKYGQNKTTGEYDENEENTSLQEMLGKRMNVERFLEIFNSSSESSLEASQCEALIYALKNRLAVIQGPPGCGKTFVGVKIVELLQSLSPKLDKPILLLTYKNHALDEFLKQILGFCKIEEIVRIGGRSKESQLESCNLKKIQSGINYDNATRAEIQSTKAEIAAIESKIREVSKKVEASSYLTQSSLVDELEEEQLQTLIIEAGWGSKSMTYRLDKKIADKKRMKKLLDSVSHIYESVKKFLQIAMQNRLEKSEHIGLHCINIFRKAFQNWFPDRKELQKMKEFQSAFILQIQSDSTTDEDTSKESDHKSKKSENADDDDSGDEEHVKHLLETRNAGAKQGVKSDDLLLFDLTEAKTKNEILVKMSEYPPNMVVSSQIRNVNNLWSLNEIQRLQFLYCILNEKTTRVSQELNDLIKQMQTLINRREELEMTEKVKLLSDKKIIGVTITGASINHDLIHRIGPSVVIVEEAAEILEPSLLAALTSSIEHLILIGDHKQLRPQVDTYELCKNFNFDVSMMERLINSGFPFRSLAKQNRMRPEFSALLHDIYPNLEDNMPLVSQNMPLNCIEKSMFFWCHDDPEKKDRTYSNVKEAERIIALVMFLLRNGVRPSDITVLAAYQGQTKLLRKMMKQENRSTPQFFKEYDESGEEIEDSVDVQTIDMYQGDENKYVIISLVRSNKENRIGFLNKMSRRCVAQSRAKCGMYFVGNLNTLRGAKSSCWLKLITGMMEQGCVGHEFPLQCTRHETSKYKAKDSYSMKEVNAKPTLLCNRLCGNAYSNCDKHHCNKLCFPSHSHASCPVRIDDRFPDCGHEIKRRCHEKISDLRCPVQSVINLPCGHTGKKKCFQNVSDVRCAVRVTATFPQCGHKTKKPCYVDMWTIKCQYHCREINSCGIHRCKYICGNDHRHDNCQELIDYLFPQCKHPSPRKKKCSDEIFWKCRYKVTFMGTCGHPIKKECNQHEGEVTCSVMPCTRLRKCGHPCANSCGEDCEKGECKQCLQVFHKKMEKFREAAMRRVKELEKKIKKKEIPKFFRDEIRDTGSTAAEYQKVKDQVLNFIQPCHHWFPSITKIEKVTNLELEKKFEVAKSKAFGDHIDIKFHGTSNNNLNNIIKDGFKMPDQKPPTSKRGMFGQGIYFATDSSKSAQKIYTQGSQKLLLCQVILGRSKQVRKADYTLNKQKLRSKQYDSVYAPRGSAVKNDEFVIFDPDQALPQYIIHFSDAVVPPSPLTLKVRERFKVKKLTPLRTVDIKDPFQMYYNWADSHFRRMAASSKPPLSKQQANIKSIDIVINKDLEGKFEATKKTFQNQGISDKEILAYHGTDKKNIDSILRHNLQLSYAKRQAYGKGNYFSEFPSISLGYGDGLLLCRILPGKEFVDASSSNIPEGFNSKKVLLSTQNAHFSGATTTTASSSSTDVSGEMIIIENPDQILPFFVIHR